jgi:hypothetical protein
MVIGVAIRTLRVGLRHKNDGGNLPNIASSSGQTFGPEEHILEGIWVHPGKLDSDDPSHVWLVMWVSLSVPDRVFGHAILSSMGPAMVWIIDPLYNALMPTAESCESLNVGHIVIIYSGNPHAG